MLNDILIVFSNYNGNRTCKDFKTPRVKATIDSFIDVEPDAYNYNVLLLDCGSDDGSEDILKSYAGGKWIYKRKTTEDFYLGTLRKLAKEYQGSYKYLMVIDNDQYFFRSGMSDISNILKSNSEYIVCQSNEMSYADAGKSKIAWIYEDLKHVGKRQFGVPVSYKRLIKDKPSWFENLKPKNGLGIISLPKKKPKRLCWMYYGYSSVVVSIEALNEAFKSKTLKGNFTRNNDRIAYFSSHIHELGKTTALTEGMCINVGFRTDDVPFSVSGLVDSYKKGFPSIHLNKDYSFLYRDGILTPPRGSVKC